MKIKLLIVAIISVVFVFSTESCKKGSEDPALSLRSRTARLCGAWTVKHHESTTTTYTTSASNSITHIFDQGKYSINNTSTETETGTYVWTVTIDKNGIYNISKEITPATGPKRSDNENGIWYWAGGNKDLGLKNKEMVNFSVLQYTNGNTYSGTPTSSYTWVIKELKNKEIIINSKWQGEYKDKTETYEGNTTLVQ
jgi:hypothetical protein